MVRLIDTMPDGNAKDDHNDASPALLEPPAAAAAAVEEVTASSSTVEKKRNLALLSRLFGFCTAPTTASTNTTPSLLEDVDHVVASSKDDHEARTLLRGMVSDLLKENDDLTQKLTTANAQVQTLTHERDLIRNEYQDQLSVLQTTVERGLGRQQDAADAGITTTTTTTSSSTALVLTTPDTVLSPEQATELIVQTLSRKVEELHTENGVIVNELQWTRERMEDLESLNEARMHTIDALESVFLHTNSSKRNGGGGRRLPRRSYSDSLRDSSGSRHHHRTSSRHPLSSVDTTSYNNNTISSRSNSKLYSSPILTLTNYYSPTGSIKSSRTELTENETPERIVYAPMLEEGTENNLDMSLVLTPEMGEI